MTVSFEILAKYEWQCNEATHSRQMCKKVNKQLKKNGKNGFQCKKKQLLRSNLQLIVINYILLELTQPPYHLKVSFTLKAVGMSR